MDGRNKTNKNDIIKREPQRIGGKVKTHTAFKYAALVVVLFVIMSTVAHAGVIEYFKMYSRFATKPANGQSLDRYTSGSKIAYAVFNERTVRIKYSKSKKTMRKRINTAKKKMPKWIRVYLTVNGKKTNSSYWNLSNAIFRGDKQKGYVTYDFANGIGVSKKNGRLVIKEPFFNKKLKYGNKYRVYYKMNTMKKYKCALRLDENLRVC